MERKKIVCLSLLFFVTLFANAQTQRLYNAIVKKDKFDDVIWRKNAKTLVTKTDTTFIVETKGQKPVEYGYISVEPFYKRVGSKDSLISFAKDVYGFDHQYVVMTRDVVKQLGKEMVSGYKEMPDSQRTESNLREMLLGKLLGILGKTQTITFRTISKFGRIYEYDSDLFWIEYSDGSRVIYYNE